MVVDAIECSSNRSTRVGATDGRKETDDNMPRRTTFRSDQTEDREDRFRSLLCVGCLSRVHDFGDACLWCFKKRIGKLKRRLFFSFVGKFKILPRSFTKTRLKSTYTTWNSFAFARRFLSQAKSVLQRKKIKNERVDDVVVVVECIDNFYKLCVLNGIS